MIDTQRHLVRFDQIFGQDAAIAPITRAYQIDRLPHGWIFAGPVGVGKATTARALAGLFLCEKPKGLSPCGACAACRSFDAGNHPDYHVIYRQLARLESEKSKARDISVNAVREFLVAKAANKSVLGIGKAFVVEEADLMSAAAQNALLKTLEEPAGRTLIILLTDQPDALLPTIRSRCQLVRFASLEHSIVRKQLQARGIAADVAAAAASFAEGSLGLALKWIEDGVVEAATRLSQILQQGLQGNSAESLQEWFRTAAKSYAARQLERDSLASEDQATREGLVLYLKLVSQLFRRRLREVIDDADSLEKTCAIMDAICRAETYTHANVNIALVCQQFVGVLNRCQSPSMKSAIR